MFLVVLTQRLHSSLKIKPLFSWLEKMAGAYRCSLITLYYLVNTVRWHLTVFCYSQFMQHKPQGLHFSPTVLCTALDSIMYKSLMFTCRQSPEPAALGKATEVWLNVASSNASRVRKLRWINQTEEKLHGCVHCHLVTGAMSSSLVWTTYCSK